jgi:hypothetical protein
MGGNKMMTKMISIDLDRASPVLLLRAYITAKRMFPDTPIEVYVSPSGVGFRLKIHKQATIEENLKIRALLWDDPVRLSYALKKWALNPKEEYIDLIFDEKNVDKSKGGREKPIDMEAILKPHKDDIDKINEHIKNGETDKAEELVQKVAKQIEPELAKHKKKQYVGCIAFKGDEKREALEEICMKIMEKDKTFSWRMYPCWFPEFDWILAVFTDDKNKAWRRIVWLKNKARLEPGGKQILKDADTRLFVKERTVT